MIYNHPEKVPEALLNDIRGKLSTLDGQGQLVGDAVLTLIPITKIKELAKIAKLLKKADNLLPDAPRSGLFSTIEGGPISPADLARMQSAFERNGGKILQNVDGYLRFRNAEGVTDNAKQFLLRSDASRSAVFEEFIHTAQHRTGRFNEAVGKYGNIRGEAFLEIEAAEKLIRNRKAWQLPNSETRQTIERLRNYRGIFNGE